jgi:four helix bundle protein
MIYGTKYKKQMSYKSLEIYQLACRNAKEIHWISIRELPKFEMYETGAQIRRSSKSVRINIVEGYGRRRYKNEFIRFLTYAIASNDETLDHLEILVEVKSLRNEEQYVLLKASIELLGKKLNNFIKAIEKK